jgi:hypothetical protein
MAQLQIISGSALSGLGTALSSATLDVQSNPTKNNVQITNTSTTTQYITIEQIDKTEDPLFVDTMKVNSFTADAADGVPSVQAGLFNITSPSVNGGDYVGWSVGLHEFRFYAERPLTSADAIEYLSKDNDRRLYKFYWLWDSDGPTRAGNLIEKINDVQVDRMQEFNAFYKSVSFINIQPDEKSTAFNGMDIYHSGSTGIRVAASMNAAGRNPYPQSGAQGLNSDITPYVPFVTTPYSVGFLIPPNTNDLTSQTMQIFFGTTSGTVNTNKFRIRAASGLDTTVVTVFDNS